MKLRITAEEIVKDNLDKIDPDEEVYGLVNNRLAIRIILGDETILGVNRNPNIKTEDLNPSEMRFYYESKAVVYTLASRLENSAGHYDSSAHFKRKADSSWRMHEKCLADAAMSAARQHNPYLSKVIA